MNNFCLFYIWFSVVLTFKLLTACGFRFNTVFSHDSDSLPRLWTGKEDIKSTTLEARSEVFARIWFFYCSSWTVWLCPELEVSYHFFVYLEQSLKLLSMLAAIRLDEKSDRIENILFSRLLEGKISFSSRKSNIADSCDPLASSSWEEVQWTYLSSCICLTFTNDLLTSGKMFIRFHQRTRCSHQCSVYLCGDNSWQKQSILLVKLFQHR